MVSRGTVYTAVALLGLACAGCGESKEANNQSSVVVADADNRYFSRDSVQAIYNQIKRADYTSIDSLTENSSTFIAAYQRFINGVQSTGNYLGNNVRVNSKPSLDSTLSGTDIAAITSRIAERFGVPYGFFVYDNSGCPQGGILLPQANINPYLMKQKSGDNVRVGGLAPLVFNPNFSDYNGFSERMREAVTAGAWEFPGATAGTDGERKLHLPKDIIFKNDLWRLAEDTSYTNNSGANLQVRIRK